MHPRAATLPLRSALIFDRIASARADAAFVYQQEVDARRKPIVGVNATPEGVKAIKAGELLASASFDAMQMACLAVEAAIRVLSGERVPAEIVLPVEVVDRANCEAWDLPYEHRPLPDWSTYVSSR